MWQRAFRRRESRWLILGTGFGVWILAHFFCLMFFAIILSGNASTMTIGAWVMLAISLTWSLFGLKTTKRFWRFSYLIERYTGRERRFKDRQIRT
jgi:hypothetical protein